MTLKHTTSSMTKLPPHVLKKCGLWYVQDTACLGDRFINRACFNLSDGVHSALVRSGKGEALVPRHDPLVRLPQALTRFLGVRFAGHRNPHLLAGLARNDLAFVCKQPSAKADGF